MDQHDLSEVRSADGPSAAVHGAGDCAAEQARDRCEPAWRGVPDQLADDVDARRVVAAGDQRELTLVREHLPTRRQDGGRALRTAQVATPLLTTDAAACSTLFSGPAPTDLATRREDLAAGEVDDPKEGPMIDVLVRAALGTAAGVQLVPHEPATAPRGGVGAVLRCTDAPGTTSAQQ